MPGGIPLPRVPGPAREPQIDLEDWKRRQALAKLQPKRDEIREQIDFIRWVVDGDSEPKTPPLGYPDEPDPQTEELERLRAENEALRNRPPEIRTVEVEKIVERVVEVPAAVPEPVVEQEAEPLPDPLARLVPEDVEAAKRKQWLRDRYVELGHLVNGASTFGPPTDAVIREHQDLERYRGLFT